MRLKLILAAFLGLSGTCYAICDPTTPPTVTSRLGLSQPVINACGWGTTTNNNWGIVDSSAACLACGNTFTSTQTVNYPLLIKNANQLRLYDSSTHFIAFSASPTSVTANFMISGDGSPGQFLQTDGGGNLSWGSSGGGTSSLAVNKNGVLVSSPTGAINILGPPFTISLVGGNTAQVGIDYSSVTAQGNAFNQANQLVQLDGSARLPPVDGSQLTNLAGVSGFTIYPASGTAILQYGVNATTGVFSSDLDVNGSLGVRAGQRLTIYGSGDVATSSITNPAASSSQLRIDAINGIGINTVPVDGIDLSIATSLNEGGTSRANTNTFNTTSVGGLGAVGRTGTEIFNTGSESLQENIAFALVSTGTSRSYRTTALAITETGSPATGISVDAKDTSTGVGSGANGLTVSATSILSSGQGNTAINLSASGGATNHAIGITGGDIFLNGAAGTNGQVLTSGGANIVPSWTTISGGGSSLPLPAGATNYVQVTSSLQSGSTFYVSSGTVSGQLTAGSLRVNTDSSFNILKSYILASCSVPTVSWDATSSLALGDSTGICGTSSQITINDGMAGLNTTIQPNDIFMNGTIGELNLNSSSNDLALIINSNKGQIRLEPGQVDVIDISSLSITMNKFVQITSNTIINGALTSGRPIFISTVTGGGSQGSNVLINTNPASFSGNDLVSIGRQAGNACLTCNSDVFIGTQAGLRDLTDTNSVLIGYQAGSTLQDINNASITAVGEAALSNTSDTIKTTAIGRAALFNNVHGTGSTALGSNACQNASGVDVSNAICIGADSRVDTNGTMAIGSVGEPITDVYMNSINPGLGTNGLPITFHAQASSGTNATGGNFIIAGGQGSGTGASGAVIVRIATTSASGSLQNSLVTVSSWTANGFTLTQGTHFNVTNSTQPTLSSCGANPSVTGTDSGFTITGGSGSTGCTATFSKAFANTPTCTVTNQAMSVVNAMTYSVSATAVTIAETGLGTSKIDVICVGHD